MKERFYFKLHMADWLQDTMHLSLEQQGAYLRLLCLMYSKADAHIPKDPKWIAPRVPCSPELISQLLRDRSLGWVKAGDMISQKRVMQECELIDRQSERAKENAERRWAKSQKSQDKDACKGNARVSNARVSNASIEEYSIVKTPPISPPTGSAKASPGGDGGEVVNGSGKKWACPFTDDLVQALADKTTGGDPAKARTNLQKLEDLMPRVYDDDRTFALVRDAIRNAAIKDPIKYIIGAHRRGNA